MSISVVCNTPKVVTRGYHLYALPSMNRRTRVILDWALAAGRPPDDIALGLIPTDNALITTAEDHSG